MLTALVVSLRNFIREVPNLDLMPANLTIPQQGPARSSGVKGKEAGAADGGGKSAAAGVVQASAPSRRTLQKKAIPAWATPLKPSRDIQDTMRRIGLLRYALRVTRPVSAVAA